MYYSVLRTDPTLMKLLHAMPVVFLFLGIRNVKYLDKKKMVIRPEQIPIKS